MSWANPWMLFALLLPAAAVWLAARTRRNVTPLWPAVRRVSIGPDNSMHAAKPRMSDPAYIIIGAVALGIIALARPQWGEQSGLSFGRSREVVIALDLSRSMWAEDMPGPTSRLRAAKALLASILDNLRGENVGLVVFAGTAFVQVPMSPDYQIVREFLPSLDPNYMPVGGSDYDRMLGAALEGFGEVNDRDRYLIVLSDGESTTEGWERRVPDLLRRNIHVVGIGFGVTSHFTPATLQTLADRTEGLYVGANTLANGAAVRKLIKDTVESGRAGRMRNTDSNWGVERFQWFLAPAVLLGLVSLAREFRRHPRSRQVRRTNNTVAGTTAAVLTLVICTLAAPPVNAHHDSEAGFEVKAAFKGDPAVRVRAIASHMGKFGYDPFDLDLLVQAAIQYAVDERSKGRLPLEGVMQDAIDAAQMGKTLDPKLAAWDRYEARIHDLLAPLPVQAQNKEEDKADKNDDDDDDEQNYKPVPLRKAKDKNGKDLYGRNTRSRSEFALGDLSGDETFAPQEPHGGRHKPSRPAQNSTLAPAANSLDAAQMAEARRNMATVVKADSPARVHQLLNGEIKPRTVAQDW